MALRICYCYILYNVWNKTPESIFLITRASEVLNKYVVGLWSDNFTAAFFVTFIVTVFVPDSVVAAQLCPPKMLRTPEWLFLKKYFDITAHPGPNGLHNKIS